LTNFNPKDVIQVFNPVTQSYSVYSVLGAKAEGSGIGYDDDFVSPAGDPIVPNVGQGFFYQSASPISWVENYSVSQ
jgi:hypothetical protein